MNEERTNHVVLNEGRSEPSLKAAPLSLSNCSTLYVGNGGSKTLAMAFIYTTLLHLHTRAF